MAFSCSIVVNHAYDVTGLALFLGLYTSTPPRNATGIIELAENGAFPDRKRIIALNESVDGQRKMWDRFWEG